MTFGSPENKPYIGFTGNNNPENVKALSDLFNSKLPLVPSHRGMMGFLVNKRSINGEVGNGRMFPPYAELPELLKQAKMGGLTSLHYVPHTDVNISDQIQTMLKTDDLYDQGLVDAVQLNNVWPDSDTLAQIKTDFPGIKTIIQANKEKISMSSDIELAHAFMDLDGLVDYLLFDPSAGKGMSFDPASVRSFYMVAGHFLPNSAIILAGGFDSFTTGRRIERIGQMLHSKKFGIDAQTGLRDIPRHGQKGVFSLSKAENYLDQAVNFFKP